MNQDIEDNYFKELEIKESDIVDELIKSSPEFKIFYEIEREKIQKKYNLGKKFIFTTSGSITRWTSCQGYFPLK